MTNTAQRSAHLVQAVQQEGQQLLAVLLRVAAELRRKLGQLRGQAPRGLVNEQVTSMLRVGTPQACSHCTLDACRRCTPRTCSQCTPQAGSPAHRTCHLKSLGETEATPPCHSLPMSAPKARASLPPSDSCRETSRGGRWGGRGCLQRTQTFCTVAAAIWCRHDQALVKHTHATADSDNKHTAGQYTPTIQILTGLSLFRSRRYASDRNVCMSGGVCARHCRLLFMKHVLPRLPRPARPWERPADCAGQDVVAEHVKLRCSASGCQSGAAVGACCKGDQVCHSIPMQAEPPFNQPNSKALPR